jgi:hypothetical protein
MRFHRGFLLIASLSLPAACAAQDVTPVRISQDGDAALGCAAIRQQMDENRVAAAKYLKDDRLVEQRNTALTVAGFIPWAGLLTAAMTNLSNQDQIRARALLDRQERLEYLAKQKGCGT